MDQPQRTIMARTFPSVRDAEPLNERGHQLGCAKRQRLMPPLRFGLSVIASLATQQGPSIAAFPRDFHAWWDAESSDKAFSTQVATARGAAVFRPSLGDLMGQLPMQGLRFAAGQALSACHRLGMQDGSACARHDALAQGFPGRFSAVKPAAVARHGTLDWLHDAPLTMVVRPETAAEHAALPAPERLRGERVLADRGYLELA
jgi:hypothetical protein